MKELRLETLSWWKHPTSSKADDRLLLHFVEGAAAYLIDGRECEGWLLFGDGMGMFVANEDGSVTIHDKDSAVFLELVEYLHRENWVDTVLDQMDNLWEDTLIDEFNIPFDHNTPEICDAAYEWLPYVLPKTYAKVFPDDELIRKLTIAFYIDQTDPQTINFDQ